MARPHRIDPLTRLRDCPQRAVAVDLATPLSERLDALLGILDEEGERTSRREIVSALILAAPEDGASLAESIKQYRRALARDAAVAGDAAEVLELRRPRPGPRPRRAEGGTTTP